MLMANVYDMSGKQVGQVEISGEIFGIEPNQSAMHEAVKNHLANRRQGTQSALTRAEVRGGGAKPYRQKGTGRARHGSTRAPQWRHGGVAFAPKPRTYRYTINKKVRRLALKSALSARYAAGGLIVIDELKVDSPAAKAFAGFLSAVGAAPRALVVTAGPERNVALSGRNLAGVKTAMANLINTYDVLHHDKLVLDKAALTVIEEVFA